MFDEVAFMRSLRKAIVERFKYHLEDHWGWELALQRTSEDINRPLFYVRRIVERVANAA